MKQLREYESELREIEKVIDLHHKNLDIFKKPYQQATIDILRTFEKLANHTINIAAKLSSLVLFVTNDQPLELSELPQQFEEICVMEVPSNLIGR